MCIFDSWVVGSSYTKAVFTWARITFRKTFWIAIQNVIEIVIWTTCVHMHCKRLPQSRSGSAHCEVIFCSYCAVRTDWPMHGFSMASARISKMHMHKSCSERALRSHVLESGFLGGSRSKTVLFSCFKMRFKSLIWNSFAFTWAKNQAFKSGKGRMTFWNVFRNVIL